MACVFDVDGVILNTPLEGADRVEACPDALRFLDAVSALGWPLAVVSSSHDANEMMRGIRLPSGKALLDVFAANLCIPDFASAELRVPTSRCLVVEAAPSRVEAARAGHLSALGVARGRDANALWRAGANLVVTSLDNVALDALAEGTLRLRAS